MRSMLLSFKPEVFEQIAIGKKIFEHRKVFPNEPIRAYIYISRPIQAIAGILILDNKTSLDSWKELYHYDKDAVERINEFMTRNQYVMQIKEFQNTNRIPLSEIRNHFPTFLIPQMYYYLDGLNLLNYLEENLYPQGKPIYHDFSNITSDMICRY